ncbi:YqgE/AlgH family protein [Nakamurella deserti]|uniref:YqgE/AlgH family protein n=1 Tax=Nakamurella deserti TaxID=2164074 RepID=UPI000DBE57B1|nr:YqgE/AlgH family protein [Nakamurella deserti]
MSTDEDFVAELRTGALLVATPDLTGPTFERTVIYLVSHSDGGSLGVVLNRPSEVPVHNVLPQWNALAARSQVIFVGGPMRPDAAMCVGVALSGRRLRELSGIAPIRGPVCLVDVDAEPDELAPSLRGVRLFGGHAGWAPGQLENEVERGSWFVVPGLPDDILVPPKVDLWFEVMRRQPFPLKWQAWHPGDLTRN